MIKSHKKVSEIEFKAIKRAIMKVLVDIPRINIKIGETNNNGYLKFTA